MFVSQWKTWTWMGSILNVVSDTSKDDLVGLDWTQVHRMLSKVTRRNYYWTTILLNLQQISDKSNKCFEIFFRRILNTLYFNFEISLTVSSFKTIFTASLLINWRKAFSKVKNVYFYWTLQLQSSQEM